MPQLGFTDGYTTDPEEMDKRLKGFDERYQQPEQSYLGRIQDLLGQAKQLKSSGADPALMGQMAGAQKADIAPQMAQALAQLSASAGSLGGETADATPVGQFAQSIEQQRREQAALGGQQIESAREARLADIQNKLAMAKAMRGEQKYAQEFGLKQKEAEERSEREKARAELAKKEFGLKEKEAETKRLAAQQKPVKTRTIETVDAEGKPVTQLIDDTGAVIQTYARKDPKLEKYRQKSYDERLLDLGAEQVKRFDSSAMGLSAVDNMFKALQSGDFTVSAIGDNRYTMALRMFEEALGRMQSGGAINAEERESFKAMAPTPTDIRSGIAEEKIHMLMVEMASRVKNMGFDPDEVLRRRGELEQKYAEKYLPSRKQGSFMTETAYAAPPKEPKEEYTVGEIREAQGKKWKYQGNNLWQEVD